MCARIPPLSRRKRALSAARCAAFRIADENDRVAGVLVAPRVHCRVTREIASQCGTREAMQLRMLSTRKRPQRASSASRRAACAARARGVLQAYPPRQVRRSLMPLRDEMCWILRRTLRRGLVSSLRSSTRPAQGERLVGSLDFMSSAVRASGRTRTRGRDRATCRRRRRRGCGRRDGRSRTARSRCCRSSSAGRRRSPGR
jgi:hypothetical protein